LSLAPFPPEYEKSKPNRFAGQGKAAVTLDDEVFAYLQARADDKGRKLTEPALN
jgi:hypothetical protein